MHRSRSFAAAGACALAGLVAPAAAPAATEVVYDVTFKGSGTIQNVRHYPADVDHPSDYTQRTSVKADVSGRITGVTFRDGRLVDDHLGTAAPKVTASSEVTVVGPGESDHELCTGTPIAVPTARSELRADLITPLDGSEALIFRATDELDTAWTCDGDPLGAQEGVLNVAVDPGEGPFDAEFRLPREAIGMGKIIQNVGGPPAGFEQHCETCTGGWTGQVTFVKTAERQVAGDTTPDDDLIAPLVVPEPQPAPRPPAAGDDLIAPLVLPKKATVDAKGRTVTFKASCSAGCTGTATFTASGRGRAAAAAKPSAKPLATARFKVRPGAARTIRVTLPAKARRALKRSKRLRMTVALKPKGGAVRRSTLTVRR